jgi:hypothetical protein
MVGSSEGPTSADVYLTDETTGTSNSYSVSISPGLIGKTADWIVARPCCNGGEPYTLANTVSTFFSGLAQTTNDKAFWPGSQAGSTEVLTMTNDNGEENIEIVSQGRYMGLEGLKFETQDCAYYGGCTP